MSEPLLITVVDDEEAVRQALRRVLTSVGLRVRIHASGAEFLASLPSLRPDCLVLDMHMPGLTGLDVLRRVGAGPERLPAVAISGKDDPGMRAEAIALAATVYLIKPIDVVALLDALDQAMTPVKGRRFLPLPDGANASRSHEPSERPRCSALP